MKNAILIFLIAAFAVSQTLVAQIRVVHQLESPTCGIQEAIDQCAAEGGGTVFIPKGKYVITRTIVIPASGNLLIHGEGTASTIEAAPEYSGYAAEDALQDESEIRVKDPGLFRVNDHIAIIDDTLYGEGQTSAAVITDIRGDLVILDTPLRKSYLVKRNARLVRTFHLMATEGCAHNLITPNVTIRDLQFTGGLKKNHQGLGLWQVNGGIVLMGENHRIEDCVIKDIPADGIFVGGGAKMKGEIWVTGCLVENAGRRGIHIGNDPRNVIVSNNHFKKIGGIGIYLCHGSHRVIISGNTVSGIGTYDTDKGPVDFISLKGFGQDEYLIKTQVAGIGGIGGGGVKAWEHDKYNVISNNVVYDSKGAGISFLKWFQEDGGRPGENTIISGNNIYEIGLSGIFVFAAQAIQVSGNLISGCPAGIDCSESRYCLFTGNTLRGCGTGIHFYSKDEAFPTSQNVFTNNLLVNCQIPELSGDGARLNSSGNNYEVE